jgi:uncharacterized protein
MFFHSLAYASPQAGTRLIVLGAVHGNEVCGTHAIRRLAAELDAGTLALARGTLTLVPVTNPLAHREGRRNGDRNLNRRLAPTDAPLEFEDHIANWLCPLLARHEVLLDLHSFQAGGQPFVMVGPEDNNGLLEPFSQAKRELQWVRRLGVRRAVDGWLATYGRGVEQRRAAADRGELGTGATLDLDPRYGVGSTEYMRLTGGCALTLECGQHADPQAPEVAYRAIRNTLAHFGLVDEPAPPPAPTIEGLRLHTVIDKRHRDDAFARPWQSFDALRAGELIGHRADGEAVHAPAPGWIVFPNPRAERGQEWFYLAGPNPRF